MVFHSISALWMQKYNLRTQTTPREMSRLWFTSPLKFGSAATVMRLMGALCSPISPVSAVIYPQSDLSLTHFLFSKCQWTTGGEYEIILLPLTFTRRSTIKSIELTLKDASKVLQLNQTFLQINIKWNANCYNVWGNIWVVTCWSDLISQTRWHRFYVLVPLNELVLLSLLTDMLLKGKAVFGLSAMQTSRFISKCCPIFSVVAFAGLVCVHKLNHLSFDQGHLKGLKTCVQSAGHFTDYAANMASYEQLVDLLSRLLPVHLHKT